MSKDMTVPGCYIWVHMSILQEKYLSDMLPSCLDNFITNNSALRICNIKEANIVALHNFPLGNSKIT